MKDKTFNMIDSWDTDFVFKFENEDGGQKVFMKNDKGEPRGEILADSDLVIDTKARGCIINEWEYENYGKSSFMNIEFSMRPSLTYKGSGVDMWILKNLTTGELRTKVNCNKRIIEVECPDYVSETMTKENFKPFCNDAYKEKKIDVPDGSCYSWHIRLDGQPFSDKKVYHLEDSGLKLLRVLAQWSHELAQEHLNTN